MAAATTFSVTCGGVITEMLCVITSYSIHYTKLYDFYAEDVGMVVNDLLVNHFSRYVDYDFTAKMEEDLDAISRGEEKWRPVLREFWEPFIGLLKQKEKEVTKEEVTTEKTGRICPECGKELA